MPTLRSNRWVAALAPALLLAAGCGGSSNESNIDTKGTTTSPDAVPSTEDQLKKGAEAPKKNVIPKGYPGR